jgi:integrase-like protein
MYFYITQLTWKILLDVPLSSTKIVSMPDKKLFRPNPDLKLMEQVRQVMRYHHYKYRTEQTYCDWITRYIKYHNCQKHPREMGKLEIESFLSHLASERKVSASTQRQALGRGQFSHSNITLVYLVQIVAQPGSQSYNERQNVYRFPTLCKRLTDRLEPSLHFFLITAPIFIQ